MLPRSETKSIWRTSVNKSERQIWRESKRERFTHKITQEFDGSLCSIFSILQKGRQISPAAARRYGDWGMGDRKPTRRHARLTSRPVPRRRIASESEELGRRVVCRAPPTSWYSAGSSASSAHPMMAARFTSAYK